VIVMMEFSEGKSPFTVAGLLDVTPTARIAQEDRCRVVHLAGELDIAAREVVYGACVAEGHSDVIVDLGGVTFMDCGAYGWLIAARVALLERGGSLTLRSEGGAPARLLDLIADIEARVSH
jgi:anti-anti-sigma factor